MLKEDEKFIRKAIKLALKAKGKTSPNPLVGAVIVKDGKIVSKGYHKGSGKPHAEIEAINSSPVSLADSTLYVTLEPCSIWGKTPPCVETIKQIPFKRIVIGMKDPNPSVNGRSIKILKDAGYDVRVGVCEEEIKSLNPYFEEYIRCKKTYTILKVAISSDSFIYSENSDGKYITCFESRKDLHKRRSLVDGILVGSNTINVDDPLLDTRNIEKNYKPKIIILDFSNKLDYSKNVFKDKKRLKLIIVSKKFKTVLNDRKDIKYIFVKNKKESWDFVKNRLCEYKIISLIIEGGKSVFLDSLKNDIVDEVWIYKSFKGLKGGIKFNIEKILKEKKFKPVEEKKIGEDIFKRYICLRES
ncbi:MAG: bifunctional diaminohydroxyphosphoribosylaminopyrimidine deaminase/5-amino-6-(5-phosphoribosylamino)uracil reductase RibD [candidate division WOR-3 bacterium]